VKETLTDELKLFLKEKVFDAVNNPSKEQKKLALHMHCFIIEKGNGRIKPRAVADGQTQSSYLEEETYCPTVKGAFLKAKVPENLELSVKMEGE
jgi:hypothetical protein